jgi:hypothetical protein
MTSGPSQNSGICSHRPDRRVGPQAAVKECHSIRLSTCRCEGLMTLKVIDAIKRAATTGELVKI